MTVKQRLRVGIVASPALPIIKEMGYGGTERVVQGLTEGLVARGHHVTLFAPDGSETSARLIKTGKAYWGKDDHNATVEEISAATKRALDIVYENLGKLKLDLVNFHMPQGMLDRRFDSEKIVTTEHLDTGAEFVRERHRRSNHSPVIFISETQCRLLPSANKLAVIHNGVNPNKFEPSFKPYNGGDYLVFLGRPSLEKGMHIALDVAHQAKMPLVAMYRMPATNAYEPVPKAEWEYYHSMIEPRLGRHHGELSGVIDPASNNGDRYLGMVTSIIEPQERLRDIYLRNSLAIIAPSGFPPSKWSEPFGMQVIEAMANGTPAIVYNKGGTTVTVKNGRTGYVRESVEEMVHAVKNVKLRGSDMRAESRYRVERHFSNELMVENYVRAYKSLLRREKPVLVET